GAGDVVGTNIAASTGLVVDDDGLAELLAQALGGNTGDNIGWSARRIGHNHGNSLVRPAGRACGRGSQGQADYSQRLQKFVECFHSVSSLVCCGLNLTSCRCSSTWMLA